MFRKRREFIMSEADAMTVLSIVNTNTSFGLKHIGNCGWKDSDKWFIVFVASDRQYFKITRALLNKGTLMVTIRPGGIQDLYFERKES